MRRIKGNRATVKGRGFGQKTNLTVAELDIKLAAGEEKSGLQGVFGNKDIISVSYPPKHCLQIDFLHF